MTWGKVSPKAPELSFALAGLLSFPKSVSCRFAGLFVVITLVIILLPQTATATGGVNIYGFVTDRSGQPVANATVTLLLDGAPVQSMSNPARTDTNGYYEFPGIQKGMYCLVVEKRFFSSSNAFYVQIWDKIINFTLLGSAEELSDFQAPSATPEPISTPPPPTATPAATPATSPPAPAPGFGTLLAILGIVLVRMIKRSGQAAVKIYSACIDSVELTFGERTINIPVANRLIARIPSHGVRHLRSGWKGLEVWLA